MIDLKNSVKTAVGGLCAALSIVLMFLGGISSVFVYAVPMLLGTLMSVSYTHLTLPTKRIV